MSNRCSVVYNILSHDYNNVSGCLERGVMDTGLYNKKKLITETLDLNQVFHNNVENNYRNCLNENSNHFKKYIGIYTNICDAANRNGNIILPFSSNVEYTKDMIKNLKIHNRSRSSGHNIVNRDSNGKFPNKITSIPKKK